MRAGRKPRGGRVAALAVCALASTLGVAAPAVAHHNDLRFGVQSDAEPTAEEFQRLGRADAQVLRIDFSWRNAELPGGAGYDWTKLDRVVGRAAQRNLPLLPVLVGSPDDVASQPSFPPDSDADLDRWRRFVKAIVERYGRDGEFWCQSHPLPPAGCGPSYRPITVWQAWNEPSLDTFWAKDPNPREYAELLELTRKAIESRDDEATVVMAGMPEFTGRGMDLRPYLKRLYDVDGIKKQFDVIALNVYARDEDGVEGALVRLRDTLRDVGDPKRVLWVTEVGWATGGDPELSGGEPFIKSKKGQARRLRKTFELFREKRSEYRLGTTVWYSFRDTYPHGPEDDWWTRYTGLFETDGDPKPSWPEYVSFTGGKTGGDTPLTPLPPPGPSVQSAGAQAAEAARPDGLKPSPPE